MPSNGLHSRMMSLTMRALLLLGVLAGVSDSAPQREHAPPLKLARMMPKGALVYVQSRDLAGQLNLWRTSQLYEKYFSSKSYRAFQQSRLFLKLQSRTAEFETALGFAFTEESLAMLAGGESAIAVYDLGRLEMVVASEMAQPKAYATTLFANAKNFDERTTPSGTAYFIREFGADGGRTLQRVGFAYAGGKLILASSESLLQRTLENAGAKQDSDRLSDETAVTIAKSHGFVPHDVTLWLNQSKLNANHYFKSYWIHDNVAELSKYQTGLIDLQLTANEWRERRWFVLSSAEGEQSGESQAARNGTPRSDPLVTLARFAPTNAQLMEAQPTHANDPRFAESVSTALFGELPNTKPIAAPPPTTQRDPASGSEEDTQVAGRYRHLDSRFDRDIDDEAAVKLANDVNERVEATKRFTAGLAPVFADARPVAYAVFQSPQLAADGLFVKFNRAVVVEMASGNALDTRKLEAAITAELDSRFVIGGAPERIAWQAEKGVRNLRQTLLEQGGAYAVSGNKVIIASNQEYCASLLAQANMAATYKIELTAPLSRFALVRPALIRPVFVKLSRVLDAKATSPETAEQTGNEEGEGSSGAIAFFSDNLVSLLDVAQRLREASYESAVSGGVLQEVIVYHLAALGG